MMGDNRRTLHAHSPVRKKRIQYGRRIWDATAGTFSERLHEFFKYILTPDDGFSNIELIYITIHEFRNEYWEKKLGNNGLKNITDADKWNLFRKASTTMGLRIAEFRRWLKNESLILISEKQADGQIIYYNVQNKKSIVNFLKKRERIMAGYEDGNQRVMTIHSQGRVGRRKKAEQESEEIALSIKRRNRKRYGDYDYGV